MYHYKKKSPEERKEEIEKLSQQAEKGAEEYLSSDKYKDLLDTMSKFHNYSANNCLLIALQKPNATMVGSYATWQKLNRQVNKGEHAIKIICPVPYKVKGHEVRRDPDTKQEILDKDGNPVTDEVEEQHVAFKVGNTFDISQTSQIPGKEVINLTPTHELTGDVQGYQDLMSAIKEAAPCPIETEKIAVGGAYGYFDPASNRIAVREGMSEAQTVKTAIHETAHSIMHADDSVLKEKGWTRADIEVQAESVAYVVSSHYGLDTSDYSFAYVGTWAGSPDRIHSNLEAIRKGADTIIEKMDGALEKMNEERKETQSEVTASDLAHQLDDFQKSYDPYGYKDSEIYPGSGYDEAFSAVRHNDFDNIKEELNEAVKADGDMADDAKDLLKNIEKYQKDYTDVAAAETEKETSRMHMGG
ncbi:MAG: ArdC family protein [Lactimicrobium massiliense]|nr:ArdC family protein [Lactimicrobium massiliense]MDD6727585.1 ArdC family protein [Lactimicrobium massiliense]